MKVHSSKATVQHTHAHNRSKYDQIQPNIQLFGRKHKSHQHYLTHSFSHMLIMRHTASRVKQWSECYPIFSSYDFARNTPQTHFSLLFRSLYHTYLSSGDVKAEPPECIYIKKVRKKEKHSPMNRWLSSMKISTDFHLFQNVTQSLSSPSLFFFPPQFYTLILFLFFLCASNTLINRGYWDSYMNPKQPEIKRSWEVKARLIE